jgi:general secretion pathway protein F/type IV pilus assembly protein PilC
MNKFQYTAITEAGQKITGALEADSEAGALRLLEERKLFPVAVQGRGSGAGQTGPRRRVRSSELGITYGQLADLLGSGVPLLRALDSLIKSAASAALRDLLKEIRAGIADGKTLTDALRQHPEVFPTLHTAMIQAGERAAFLEEVLRSLSVFLERLDELRSKVLGALIYPALLTALGMAVMIGALIFFVPKFEPLLAGANKKPLPTEVLFTASKIVRTYWYLLAVGTGGLIALTWANLKSPAARRWTEQWRLKVPIVGDAFRLLAITRFCRILGTMLANGVPLLQALKISKDATGSTILGERIAEAAEAVRDGKRLSEPLGSGDFFPEQILAMISVAEESNKLDKVLVQIADTVERRTNRQVDQAVRLIEPAILCLVAACIGFLALGLLLPIFTMASALGQH